MWYSATRYKVHMPRITKVISVSRLGAVKPYRRDITVEITFSHWLFFWERTQVHTFRGSSTVWHDVDCGFRPGTSLEIQLEAILGR